MGLGKQNIADVQKDKTEGAAAVNTAYDTIGEDHDQKLDATSHDEDVTDHDYFTIDLEDEPEKDDEPEEDDEQEEDEPAEDEPEEDPWNAAFKIKTKIITPWGDLTTCQKVIRVTYSWIFMSFVKLLCVLGLLYIFVCSLQVMSAAFQLLGGKAAGKALTESDIVNNPVGGLMIGVMVTVLVQSSSTSTSIIVSMVGAGVLTVEQAIPFIMGANIGTSVTNTIVAITQAKDRNQFRRAFGGATVHDMFNWLSVAILLPLEVQFGILYKISEGFLRLFDIEQSESADIDFLNAITKPITSHIVQIDKSAITDIALGQNGSDEVSLLMRCEEGETGPQCNHIFAYSDLTDAAVGAILLVFSLLLLTSCLLLLVRMLQWILQGQHTMKLVRKALNANFPGVFSFLTGYFAILIGAILTFLVQSSSVFTSAITPLVGMGLITIKRMYPLTLGSNIGTTGTSILAALAQPDNFALAIQISLCHLFFNILGISIWYPIPFMRNVPITLAKNLGNNTAKYRWFAIVYLIAIFFLLPMSVFALSLAGPVIFMSVTIPIGVFFLIIIVINILQAKAPKCLPNLLKNWKFLPEPLRSLRPYDKPFTKAGMCCKQCCPKCCCKNEADIKSTADQREEQEGEYMEVTKGKNVNEIEIEMTHISKPKEVIKADKDDLSVGSSDSGVESGNISTISGQLSTSPSSISLKACHNEALEKD